MQVQGNLKLAKLHLISWTWYNPVSNLHMKGLGDMIDGLLPSGMINRETFLSLTSLSHLTQLSNFQGNVFILQYIQRTCWKGVPKVNHLSGAVWHLNAAIKWYRLMSAASPHCSPHHFSTHGTELAKPAQIWVGKGFVEIKAKKSQRWYRWGIKEH